ncbi:MAG: amino acid ABC transporter permease [Verrucomicrobiales bacterium]
MKNAIAWGVLVVIGAGFCFFFFVLLRYDYEWDRIGPYWGNLANGWGMTVLVSAGALLLSILGAAALTTAQLSGIAPARWAARGYVEVVRGTPLLVQILIGYYMFAPALGLSSRFWIGIALLAGFAAAYLAEIFRGGIESVPRSQVESARAVGFTEAQAYRHVILPQAVRRVLPSVAGQFANLIKDSSLLYVIGLAEFTAQARQTNSNTYSDFAAYIPLALGYLALTLPMSAWSRALEKKFRYDS